MRYFGVVMAWEFVRPFLKRGAAFLLRFYWRKTGR